MIWKYQDTELDPRLPIAKFDGISATHKTRLTDWLDFVQAGKHFLRRCKYCSSDLKVLASKIGPYFEGRTRITIHFCPFCGWWAITWFGDLTGVPEGFFHLARAQGSLRNLDLSDISVPTNELRLYLIAKYDERFILNPRKFEDIVGGIFSDFGYEVRVTAFSGDDGIDVVVLDGAQNDIVGVQVKRYRGKIEAEQIRSFAGALLLKGITKGVFVTTSSFRKGALTMVDVFEDRGISIDLWDSVVFFDRLKLSQRPIYTDVEDESAPFHAFWQEPSLIPTIITQS